MLKQIERMLTKVEKPARYLGGELNVSAKDWDAAQVRIALAFPDLYDLGTAYHGFRILYERINAHPAFLADRAFAPWPDFAAELRRANLPLYALDHLRPLRDFDLLGFTLQHELNYSNVLLMLDLAGIPLMSAERSDEEPLVIAGGEGALAPEPLAAFIDAFVIGDGEEVAVEIMEVVQHCQAQGITGRRERLAALAELPGVYAPAFYDFTYHPQGAVADFHRVDEPGDAATPRFVKRCYDFTQDEGPVRPVTPLIRSVHDRFVVEIQRGCTRGCRFCSAGMISRPVRERTPEQVLKIVRQGLANTGYRELSLLSLSSGDYSCILPLVRQLNKEFAVESVSISLPSLRISSFDVRLASEIRRVRKTGFTFAPEAGSERLRRVINKPLAQEDLLHVVEEVFRAGWRTLKFYFMIGLPTEQDADLEAIAELVRCVYRLGRGIQGKSVRLNVSLSPFSPKPHTPFQWEAQLPRDELLRRCQLVSDRLGGLRGVKVKRHDVRAAFIEAVFARGDRRLAPVLKRAYELGCQFDGWSERFRFDLWLQAFAENGIDPAFYANRQRPREEALPWEHIDVQVSKDFLWRERERAFHEQVTPDCTQDACMGCEVCPEAKNPAHILAGKRSQPTMEPAPLVSAPPAAPRRPPSAKRIKSKTAIQRLRLTFTKQGRQRFLSHLDLIRMLQQLLALTQLPVAWSRGFHPQPMMQFSPPLSLGCESEGEHVDLFLTERGEPLDALKAFNAAAPAGMSFTSAEELPLRAPSLEASLGSADYRIELAPPNSRLVAQLERLQQSESWMAELQRKSKVQRVDLKKVIGSVALKGSIIELTVLSHQGSLIGLRRLLQAIEPELDVDALRLTRTKLRFKEPERAPRPARFAASCGKQRERLF